MYWIFYLLILMLAVDARPLCAAGIPQELPGLAAETQQAVVVEAGTGVVARVSGWERKDGPWQQVLSPVEAVVGRNGLAPEGEKREGDGRTPSGVFTLRRAFGYEENVETGLTYRQVAERDFWIDDSRSVQYNQWITPTPERLSLQMGDGRRSGRDSAPRNPTVKGAADFPPEADQPLADSPRGFTGETPKVSHEVLRRDDDLYRYAVVIEYNTGPVVPGLGSAIFLHVWRGAGQPTAGCVAVAEADLLRILRWLDTRRNPVIILRKEHDRLSALAVRDQEI